VFTEGALAAYIAGPTKSAELDKETAK
jgi:hypothetical protein